MNVVHLIAPKDKTKWDIIWVRCYESWKKKYDVVLWNDNEDLDNFIREHYIQHYNFFSRLPYQIMKLDFARLCILHKFGGIYADMDVYCYDNIDAFLNYELKVVKNDIHEFTDAEFENFLMYSVPNSKLLEKIISYCKRLFFLNFSKFDNKQSITNRNAYDSFLINNTTGSGMISSAINNFRYNKKYLELPSNIFNNRPASYDTNFLCKHLHTNIWNNESLDISKDVFYLYRGVLFNTPSNKESKIINKQDFDFFTDYTNGNFLFTDNTMSLNELIQDTYNEYFSNS